MMHTHRDWILAHCRTLHSHRKAVPLHSPRERERGREADRQRCRESKREGAHRHRCGKPRSPLAHGDKCSALKFASIDQVPGAAQWLQRHPEAGSSWPSWTKA